MDRLKASRAIARVLQPGDVLNSVHHFSLKGLLSWPPFLREFAAWQIQRYQKRHFGELSFWKSTHTRVYLGVSENPTPTGKLIWEVTAPDAQWVSLHEICHEHLRILRPRLRMLQLEYEHIRIMQEEARKIISEASGYDYGQLIDFLLFETLGFPQKTTRVFDLGIERHVCSTGVAALFDALRYRTGKVFSRLFDVVNVSMWKDAGVYDMIDQALDPDAVPGKERIRTPVERVTPAHFDNSNYFRGEFDLIAEFRKGERVK